MIQVKNELQYRLVVELLKDMTVQGFLSADELRAAKRLALEKYHPDAVWE